MDLLYLLDNDELNLSVTALSILLLKVEGGSALSLHLLMLYVPLRDMFCSLMHI